MKTTTNKRNTVDVILWVVVLLALVMCDVLTITALTLSPLWSTSIIEAIFWSLVMIVTIGSFNLLAWGMMKETFNNK